MVELLPDLSKSVKRKLDEPLFDMDAEIIKFADLLRPILGDEVAEAGAEAIFLVTAGTFDHTDPRVTKFLTNRSKKVSKAVNTETDKQLRSELSEGISYGETIEELRARIEKVYGYAAGYRSERIARTETIRAENFASQEAWRQSEVVESKEWYTAHDERVCEFCGPMNGRTIELGGKYFNQGDTYTGSQGGELKLKFESIQGPPLHANCRCTLLPVLSEAN